MTKEYRAELKALRKQRRALGSERKTIHRNCERARKKIGRDAAKAVTVITRNRFIAENDVTRGQNRESKRLDKTEKDIAARIAVLEGRLS